MRWIYIAALLFGLAACRDETEEPANPAEEDACGAAALQMLVGEPVEGKVFEGEHRIIPPNSAVTLDFRLDRLNVETDEEGRITRIYCG